MESDPVYKLVELTGTSTESLEAAIENAVARAAKTVRNLRWFQVAEIRGALRDSGVSSWQVTVKVGFVVDE